MLTLRCVLCDADALPHLSTYPPCPQGKNEDAADDNTKSAPAIRRLSPAFQGAMNDILIFFQEHQHIVRVITVHASQWFAGMGACPCPNSGPNALHDRCFALRTDDTTGLLDGTCVLPQDWLPGGSLRWDASSTAVHGTMIKLALSTRPNSAEVIVVVQNHLTYVILGIHDWRIRCVVLYTCRFVFVWCAFVFSCAIGGGCVCWCSASRLLNDCVVSRHVSKHLHKLDKLAATGRYADGGTERLEHAAVHEAVMARVAQAFVDRGGLVGDTGNLGGALARGATSAPAEYCGLLLAGSAHSATDRMDMLLSIAGVAAGRRQTFELGCINIVLGWCQYHSTCGSKHVVVNGWECDSCMLAQ
jgi:hypothetical protein